MLKDALPPAIGTDANIHKLGDRLGKEFILVLMGPPEPLFTTILSQIMMSPDLAQHKFSSKFGDIIDKVLSEEFGDKLSDKDRLKAVQKLTESAFKSTASKANQDPSKAKPNDASAGSSLTFAVKLPGKILSTNGNIDKLTNEVYWGMYPEAASVGNDIVLTASCQAK